MNAPQTTDIEVVEPGFISVRFHGKLDAGESAAVLDAISDAAAGRPYFLLEAFMSDIDGMTPEARRVAAEKLRPLPDRAIAIVGGSFAQRIIAKLVLTAVSMLDGGDRNVASFFKDSDSARAWLREYARSRNARQEE